LAQQLEEEELAEAMSEVAVLDEHVAKYRLGEGRRSDKHGQTWYTWDDDEDIESLGRLVVLNRDDVVSGRRWFREKYPDWWMERYRMNEITVKEMKEMASRSLGDYGKQFVEYKGTWYEAEEVD
jgi:hypothetical protein